MILEFIKRHKILTAIFVLLVVTGLVFIVRLGTLKVTDTNPKSGARDILTDTEIDIFFSRGIKESEKSQISIDISPPEDVSFIFSKNLLKVVPKNPLKIATTYTWDVKVNNRKIFEFTFVTQLFTPEQIAKEGRLQSQADLAFGEVYKKFLTDNPWYTALPIEKNAYRIVYDFEKKSFRVRFKVTVTPDQEETLIKQALEDLKKIGVPEPISYYTLKVQ